VGSLLDPENSSLVALRRMIEVAGPTLGVEVMTLGVHDAAEIERGIAAFAAQPNGGLIVLANPVTKLMPATEGPQQYGEVAMR
jgi:hypothetical protein